MDKGYIQVYTGNGKGKTTAAIGLAVRCAGCNNKVIIVQFMKACETGELNILSKLDNIKVKRVCKTKAFSFKWDNDQKDFERKNVLTSLEEIKDIFKSDVKLIILDEALGAISCGALAEEELLNLMNNKPDGIELVITGRNASTKIIDKADLVTEMKPIKHYMDNGIHARKGIEF